MTTSPSILLIANPASNKGKGQQMAEAVAQAAQGLGAGVELACTQARGHARDLVREALQAEPGRFTCIAACGGDGTIQEVAGTLADARAEAIEAVPPLGVVPAGRCNDFARTLGLTRDPALCARTLCQGDRRPFDLGCANGRHFCTVATLGVDAEVSSFVDKARLPLTGTPAYLYGAIRVLMRFRSIPVRLEGDFGTIEEPVFLASSANTDCYGGAIRIAPHARPDDGLLGLCIVRAISRWRALTLIPTLMRGRHGSCPEVRFCSTRQVRVTTDRPAEIWADGERLTTTPALIEALPQAIDVLAPPRHSA